VIDSKILIASDGAIWLNTIYSVQVEHLIYYAELIGTLLLLLLPADNDTTSTQAVQVKKCH
jgi:hypothetical protein